MRLHPGCGDSPSVGLKVDLRPTRSDYLARARCSQNSELKCPSCDILAHAQLDHERSDLSPRQCGMVASSSNRAGRRLRPTAHARAAVARALREARKLSCPGRASISERRAGTQGLHGKIDGELKCPVVSPLLGWTGAPGDRRKVDGASPSR